MAKRYQKDNKNLYIEEEQTTQWPKEKVQKDKQRSTKHTHKTKDRVTRTSLKTGGELRFSGRVSSSCSTSDTRRVNLVTNPVISHKRGEDWAVLRTSGTYPWSLVTLLECCYVILIQDVEVVFTNFFVVGNQGAITPSKCKINYLQGISTSEDN